MNQFDVETLIIGAGLVGSSVAMHLARLGMTGVRVIDYDLEGTLSSSELNAGGVRATWNQPLNILASKLSIEYFASVAEEVGYRPCGYLWLHTAEKFPGALQARERQQSLGWDVEVWDVAELRKKVPFIDKTDDLAGAIFGSRDGLVNPNLLKNHFRSQARAQGAVFDDRTLAKRAEFDSTGVTVVCRKEASPPTEDQKVEVLSDIQGASGPNGGEVRYRAQRVINCAGAWAKAVSEILGYPCPSHPVKRQICIFDCRDVDLTPYGMIVDSSGVYFHPEATNGLAGVANLNEPNGFNFNYDGESFFMESIWPALYERSSQFERLKHLTGWAGMYEVSPDESAILGPVEVGVEGYQKGRLFEAHSFSGHGTMQSYAAGLALAEKIVRGRYETLDFGSLTGKRFADGKPIHETAII